MISNATCIICLSKINRLKLLGKIYSSVIIPSSVRDEILIEGKEGYHRIKEAIDKGWIKIEDPKNTIKLGLVKGEEAAISLARERKDSLILDDAHAIKAAKALNVETIRTTTVVFTALKKRIITKGEAIGVLNKLIEVGYYISPKEYSILLSKLR